MSAALFVLIVLAGLVLVPSLSGVVRRGLPLRRRASRRLEAVEFGLSQKSRRSPRHAVLLHRGLMGMFFMALLALTAIPAALALSDLGVRAVSAMLAFVLPTLFVTLHARRRSRAE